VMMVVMVMVGDDFFFLVVSFFSFSFVGTTIIFVTPFEWR
jgi:hypothetical protein